MPTTSAQSMNNKMIKSGSNFSTDHTKTGTRDTGRVPSLSEANRQAQTNHVYKSTTNYSLSSFYGIVSVCINKIFEGFLLCVKNPVTRN
jgi:hypothetical protein